MAETLYLAQIMLEINKLLNNGAFLPEIDTHDHLNLRQD